MSIESDVDLVEKQNSVSQQEIEALKREKQELKEEILDLQVLHT